MHGAWDSGAAASLFSRRINYRLREQDVVLSFQLARFERAKAQQRVMAQFGSALDWGSRGRRFESCSPDQQNSRSRAYSTWPVFFGGYVFCAWWLFWWHGGPGKSVHFGARGRGYRAIRGPLRGKLSVQLPPPRVDVLLSDLGRSGWLLISETRVAMSSNLRCSQAIALKPKYCHK